MNKAYKVIWSKARNCYVVVSELAKRHAKAPSLSDVKGVVASVTAAAALSVMLGGYGVAWAETAKKGTFDNFAKTKADELNKAVNSLAVETEFQNSTGLKSINAHSAYAFGYTGKNVKLGIVDTGVMPTHIQFKGKVKNINVTDSEIANYSWEKNYPNIAHGTGVAGIMVASKIGNGMQGIAYDSGLESILGHIRTEGGFYFMKDYEDNISKVSKDIKIINNSYSSPLSKIQAMEDIDFNSYCTAVERDVATNDRIMVYSTGNEGTYSAGDYTHEVLSKNNKINKNIINVTAYNALSDNNKIAVSSNLPVGISNNSIAAPGVHMHSTAKTESNSTSGLKYSSGTSDAAPLVTGTLGLVSEAMPYLTGKQLVDTVLTTANNQFDLPEGFVTYQTDNNKFTIGLFEENDNSNINIKKLLVDCYNEYSSLYSDENHEIKEGIATVFDGYDGAEDFANKIAMEMSRFV